MCYNWFITLGSLGVVIVLMIAGVKVAGNDIFATPDRDKILDQVLYTKYISHREDPKKHKLFIMCFHKIHFLAIGSFLAASGAIVMHYTGMMAQRGPFQKEWNNGFIAASGITAVVRKCPTSDLFRPLPQSPHLTIWFRLFFLLTLILLR